MAFETSQGLGRAYEAAECSEALEGSVLCLSRLIYLFGGGRVGRNTALRVFCGVLRNDDSSFT